MKSGNASGETLDIISLTLSGQEPEAQEQFMIYENEEQEQEEVPQGNNDDWENSKSIPMGLAIPFPLINKIFCLYNQYSLLNYVFYYEFNYNV